MPEPLGRHTEPARGCCESPVSLPLAEVGGQCSALQAGWGEANAGQDWGSRGLGASLKLALKIQCGRGG